MAQLEVVKFRDLIAISAIPRFVPDLGALALELKGNDFSSTEEILINSVKAERFIIVNKNTIWVELPNGAQDAIHSIEAISSKFTKNNPTSLVIYKLGTKTKAVSGIIRLSQLFIKWMLQSPGTDIFNPERGGGLQDLAGKISSFKNMEPVTAAVTRAVSQTSSQIKTLQSRLPGLTMDERLLSADVAGLDVNQIQMEASIRIDLRAMSGNDALASLSI